MTPQQTPVHDTVCEVMSILQLHVLAMDSALNAEAMFGNSYMPSASLELAIRKLDGILGDVERI